MNFVSSSEIAQFLKTGSAHLGITGEDLIRETIADADQRVDFLKPCGFGRADVVVAVPACWLDVRRLSDLEEMALAYRRTHGRQVRVATKYMNMTRRFFTRHGVTGYRIVESLGATEGAPAAGLAELIVDITTTGATLRANGLKVLDDGIILQVAGQPDRLQGRRLDARSRPPGPLHRRQARRLTPHPSSRKPSPAERETVRDLDARTVVGVPARDAAHRVRDDG